MGVRVSAGGAVPFGGLSPVIDVIEGQEIFMAGVGVRPPLLNIAPGGNAVDSQVSSTTPALFNSGVGAPSGVIDTTTGLFMTRFTSGASAVTQGATLWTMPLNRRFLVAGALPASTYPLLRYTFEVPVVVTVAGTAAKRIGIANPTQGLTLGGLRPALVWESDPANFGGNWRPRYRLAEAGGITDEADSGVSADAFRRLGIRYTQAANPTIEWLIDGIPRFTLTGDANMPLSTASNPPNNYGPYIEMNTPAGSTMERYAARWTVERLS